MFFGHNSFDYTDVRSLDLGYDFNNFRVCGVVQCNVNMNKL